MERLALRRRSPIPYLHKLCNVCKGNISPNEWSQKTLTRRTCAKSLETQAIDQHHGGTLGSRQLHVLLSILQRAAIEQTYFATSLMPYHSKCGYVYYACIISTKFNCWHWHCVELPLVMLASANDSSEVFTTCCVSSFVFAQLFLCCNGLSD